MSNVIQFLESMGSNPAPTRFSIVHYADAVASLELGDSQRQALLDRDHATLNELLNGRPRMLFYIHAPSTEEEEGESIPDGDGDNVPDQDAPPNERQ